MYSLVWERNGYGYDLVRERDHARRAMDQWVISVRNREDSSGWSQPIVYNLVTMRRIFNGYGEHTGNDVLHEMAIHPLTPTWVVFQDACLRSFFINFVFDYSQRWVSSGFKRFCAVVSNSLIPFSYNAPSALYYWSYAVRVYRCCETRVSIALARRLSMKGMLDPNHVLGV